MSEKVIEWIAWLAVLFLIGYSGWLFDHSAIASAVALFVALAVYVAFVWRFE